MGVVTVAYRTGAAASDTTGRLGRTGFLGAGAAGVGVAMCSAVSLGCAATLGTSGAVLSAVSTEAKDEGAASCSLSGCGVGGLEFALVASGETGMEGGDGGDDGCFGGGGDSFFGGEGSSSSVRSIGSAAFTLALARSALSLIASHIRS